MNLSGKNGFLGVEIDSASVQGLLRDLKGYEKESENAINKAVDSTSEAVRMDAMNRLRGMFGSEPHSVPKVKKGRKVENINQTGHGGAGLFGSIFNRKVRSMEKEVGTSNPHAAYIEFGTGDLVFTNFDFDDDAKKVAANFKGRGIRKVNIRGDSFLNWAAVNQEKKHIERIETELNKINR